MYQKNAGTKRGVNLAHVGLFALGFFLIVGVSVLLVNRFENSTPPAVNTVTTELTPAPPGGTIAVLGQAENRQAANTPATPPKPETQYYSFTLPAGFSPIQPVEEKSPCDDTKTVKKSTTQSGAMTFTFYENGKSNDCDQTIIGDATLSFTISEIGGLSVINKEQISFCTKAQNPACPRGDGKMTLHFAPADTATTVRNSLYIVVEDTAIQPDLNAQAQGIIAQLEQILVD